VVEEESVAVRCRRRAPARPALLLGVALVLAGAVAPGVALAAPSDQPGGTTGILDSAELDALQQEAADVQADLQQRQAQVTEATAQQDAARSAADAASATLTDADGLLAERRDQVAHYADALFRDHGGPSELRLLLRGSDPGDVVAALGTLAVLDRRTEEVLTSADEQRRAAEALSAAADQALTEAQQRADAAAREVTELEAAAAAVTERLDRALEVVDRQLAQLQGEQVEVNTDTATNWQAYLNALAAAGIDLPPAAALRDPLAGLPAGLVPVGASDGGAQAGAAQLPGQPTSLLVLPVETLVAVSAALTNLGAPYAPGTSGPESYDCGSLVSSAYAEAGVELPDDQAGLFGVTTPVAPADVLPGDLVFLGSAESGLRHVGMALDPATMVAADARAGAVVVRTLPSAEVLGIGRPSLGLRDAVDVPAAEDGGLPVECGSTVYPPSSSSDGSRAWGGYPNGLIPPSAMCPLGVAGHVLRCDAAASWRAMSAAYQADLGRSMCITDSYRSYAAQVRLYGEKPALAAVPGTSNHGWGLAVDLCGGIDGFGTAQYAWMVAHAGRFGFVHPTWADPGNGREEPWHWEYAAG
jgi:cell wall-associated NlpC family hydrolase